jgi:hypothetical protein
MLRFSTIIFLAIAALGFNGCDSCTSPNAVDATVEASVDAAQVDVLEDGGVVQPSDALTHLPQSDACVVPTPHDAGFDADVIEPGC